MRAEFPLPDSETINYEVVTDKPWSGFNYYLGDYRSTVAVNADLRQQMSNLPRLVAHESYPGHHTEHCRKEAGLVARHGHTEQTLFLVNTPQCLMAEGLADLALYVAIGPRWGGWAGEIYADLGLRFDGERAEAVSEAAAALADVRQDAALMLHDEHRDVDDVVAFLRRWLLVNDERARQMLRFLSSPLWRAYTSTYVEGYRLLRAWLDGRPAGVGLTERFGRLLDEPLIPSALRARDACTSPQSHVPGGGVARLRATLSLPSGFVVRNCRRGGQSIANPEIGEHREGPGRMAADSASADRIRLNA